MLPLTNIAALNMNFSLVINGSTTPNEYTVEIPVTNKKFLAGYSYVYETLLSEEVISISTAQVKNWIEVNETGTPLLPTPAQ